jgi:hypothetical protein
MLDLTKPEIEQAYRLGVAAGLANAKVDADRAAQATENRIVYELERYRVRVEKENPSAAGHVAVCIGIINGEVY